MKLIRDGLTRQIAIVMVIAFAVLKKNKKPESSHMRNIIINPPKMQDHLPAKPIIIAPMLIRPHTSDKIKLRVKNKMFTGPMTPFAGPLIDPYYAYKKPGRERRKLNKLLFNSTPFNFYFPQGAKKPLTWVTEVKVGPNAAKEEPILEGLRAESELKLSAGIGSGDRLGQVKSLLKELTERVEKMENDIKLKDSHLDVMVRKFENIQFGRG